MNENNHDTPGRGFGIFLACMGIYWVIDTIIDAIDLIILRFIG